MGQYDDQVYHSFLVRCWLMPRALGTEPVVWRFEVREITAESDLHRFSDLEGLREFIAAKLAGLDPKSSA